MCFVPASILLVVPGRRAVSDGPEKPEGIRCWPGSFTRDGTFGETDIGFPGTLVEIPLLRRFEATRALKDHVVHIADVFEIKTVAKYPVDAYIADHQHARLSILLGFCPHQPCKHPYILRVCFNYGHTFSSLAYTFSTARCIVCAFA